MWRRTSSFNSSVVSSEPSLNCTELSIINESIHPIIFTGNTNNIHNHSYDSLTSQLRLLNRFRNYRIPASYSVRSTSNVNCNFNCGTKHKMKKEKHLCCQTKNCEAEYLTTSCSVINKWKVFLVKPHNHIVLSAYNKIVVGCGSDDDHFNICCTSYRLLSYLWHTTILWLYLSYRWYIQNYF